MTNKCPACGNEATFPLYCDESSRYYTVECIRCGEYKITKTLKDRFDGINKLALSHWIRKQNHAGVKPDLSDPFFNEDFHKNLKLPNPAEQADNLIEYLGNTVQTQSDYLETDYNYRLKLSAIVGCSNLSDLGYLIKYLYDSGLIEADVDYIEAIDTNNNLEYRLTFQGWQRYEELKKVRKDSKKVFVAMGYGNSDSERLYSEILPDLIKKELGLELIILRDNLRSGIVDNIMREDISQSCLLLAEMTNYNKGAYWEAGFAEGLKIPVIYLCEKSVFESTDKAIRPHFDVNHCTFIPWSFDTIVEDMKQLKATIRRTIPEKVKHEDL